MPSIFEPVNTQQALPWQRPELRAPGARTPYELAQEQKRRDTRSMFAKKIALPIAAFATGGAALGAMGGGAAGMTAGLPAGMAPGGAMFGGSVTAPAVAGSGMTLKSLWDIGNLGLQGFSAISGNRSNNRALDKQIGMQERQIAAQLQADAEARAEAKRQFDANQANEARRMAAEDEERGFARTEREAAQRDRDYSRQLVEQREARRAPYRAASRAALGRLGDFLGVRF